MTRLADDWKRLLTFRDAVAGLHLHLKYRDILGKCMFSIGLVQQRVDLLCGSCKIQAVYDSQAYSRSRATAYAALNQDEMRYDDLTNSTTTWIDAINAIKQEFPK